MVPSFTLVSSTPLVSEYIQTLVWVTGRGHNKTVVYLFPLTGVPRWGKVWGCWTCWLHGGWLTDTKRSERRLLPGTAFSTGLHPLKCRGSRHFCTKCRTVFIGLSVYKQTTSSLAVFHHLITIHPSWSVLVNLPPVWVDQHRTNRGKTSRFRLQFQNKIDEHGKNKGCGFLIRSSNVKLYIIAQEREYRSWGVIFAIRI